MGTFEGRVEPGEEMRADLFLSSARGLMTRSQLRSRSASIAVNGKPAKPSRELKEGDLVSVAWEEESPPALEAEDIPLSVLFEDREVLVVNKAQGMVTHPANGNWSGTLVNAFLWRLKAEAAGIPRASPGPDRRRAGKDPSAPLRPGVVHRLDKDTSGAIILAKNNEALAFLAGQFAGRTARKRYLAIVKGIPPATEGLIDEMLGRNPRDRKLFAVVEGRGKRSLTKYRLVRAYGEGYSLISLELKTGRTHQIRVHMRHIGCPILGDPLYGRKDALFPDASLMLHAYRLRIMLPGEATPRTFTAPLPARFRAVIERLTEKKGGPAGPPSIKRIKKNQ